MAKKCKQEKCPINNGGTACLESLRLDECPHFYTEEEDSTNQTQKPEQENIKQSTAISLFSGEELTSKEIQIVTNRFDAIHIIVIGESNSGKTTLLATLFDLFQMGPFAGLFFNGSVTMLGFERRCHRSRLPSGGSKPETEKTIASDFKFLHLALRPESDFSSSPINLLLSDISGERFRLARNNADAMKELQILKRVNHLLYLVDGAKLKNPLERTGILFSTDGFIQKAIDEEIFTEKTVLNIVVSKWDLLFNDDSLDFKDFLENHINSKFKFFLKQINFSYIASRPNPPSEEVCLGYGLKELLSEWIKPEKIEFDSGMFASSLRQKNKRFFNKFSINSDEQ